MKVSSQFSVSGRDKGLLSNGATMQARGMRNTGGEDRLQSTDSKRASRSMQPSAMAVITLLFYILSTEDRMQFTVHKDLRRLVAFTAAR